ncbi:MAG: ATP-binding cassette domain-containing protein [Firmicutes bacterium]|nr:ATP-binding cassette domain-containing protein [Alicyclobacillaceae bacterium]MCL6496510.1 ATP-binding cassette domain-containing protein [Bacillota bacterium]
MNTVLNLRGVSFIRGHRAILRDLSWTVEAGQHWVLLGPNGSGKTSLLNLIMGYQWPSAGAIELLGHRFGTTDLRLLRRHVGWVSAALSDWLGRHHGHRPAWEVVAAGALGAIGSHPHSDEPTRRSAFAWLAAFGLAGREETPYQLLSQGERQRTLLARAWLASPRLLILDEPCAGLDLSGREQLLTALNRLAAQPDSPTLIYVTHHPEEVIPVITHALLLRAGEVLAQGPKTAVIAPAELGRLFDLPVEVQWRGGRPWVTVQPL